MKVKVAFDGIVRIFNKKSLVDGIAQIRLTIDAVGGIDEQKNLMKSLSDLEGDDVVKVVIVK